MPAISVCIGPHQFSSISDAIAFVRLILYRYALGEQIVGEDEVVVRHLLLMHPDCAQKLDRHEISHFEVAEQPEQYKVSRSFVVVRSDGHRDDFSFMKALRNRK